MKNTIKVGCSPITNTIYAGKVSDKGMWIGAKDDVTKSAVSAVAELLLKEDSHLKFIADGKEYVLQVVDSTNRFQDFIDKSALEMVQDDKIYMCKEVFPLKLQDGREALLDIMIRPKRR